LVGEYSADDYVPLNTVVNSDDNEEEENRVSDTFQMSRCVTLKGTGNFSFMDFGHRMQLRTQFLTDFQ
jgi:hypothetical protein